MSIACIKMDENLINNEMSANENIVGKPINTDFNSIDSPSLNVSYSAVTVSTSQLENLYDSGPIEILTPPGDGLMYIIHGCAFSLDERGTIFNDDFSNSFMSLIYNSDDRNQILCYIPGIFFLDYIGDRTTYTNGYTINVDKSYIYTDECVNKSIAIYPSSLFKAEGGSTRLRVHVWYTIIEANF